ncbi:MAG: helix-turn-helix domain-containing protein [Planctomycetota bacterium]
MRLHWRDLPQDHLHWRRVFYRPGSGFPEHAHDFAECFLVEDGTGEHLLEGGAQPLRSGDLVFIHPSIRHGLRTGDGSSMTLTNIAVSAELHRELQQRFFAGRDNWPWSPGAAARSLRLSAQDRSAWEAWVGELERGGAGTGPEELLAVTLLCDLLRRVVRTRAADPLAACPAWLRDAILLFDEPRHYAGGVHTLARLAGVGREHLSRSVRRHLGCTATTLINRLRLEHACTQLACTNRPIQEISLDAGFGNLAHYHRVFKQVIGCTPGVYRERATRAVV